MDPNRAGNFQSPLGFFNPPKTKSKRVTMAPPPFNLVSSEQGPLDQPSSSPSTVPLPQQQVLPTQSTGQRKDPLSTGLEFLGEMDLSSIRSFVEYREPDASQPQSFHFEH